MPTRETERQRTERLLRDMLAQARARAGFADSVDGDDEQPADLTFAALLRRTSLMRRVGQLRRAMPRLSPDAVPRLVSRVARPWSDIGRWWHSAGPVPAAAAPARMAHPRATGPVGSRASRGGTLESIVAAPRPNRLETVPLPRSGKVDRIDSALGAISPGRDRNGQGTVQSGAMNKKSRRSDFVMAACGVVLGLTCAMFPWYIFFNQEQFGVQGIRFGGRGHNSGRIVVDPKPTGGTPVALQDLPKNLDIFTTGTLSKAKGEKDKDPAPQDQPFPAVAPAFRLVHVANGRAMIEDDAGLWIVQPGSTLPDSSLVKAIEQRQGKWVLVTSTDRVVEMSK